LHQVAHTADGIIGHDAAFINDDHVFADLLHQFEDVGDVEDRFPSCCQLLQQVAEEQGIGDIEARLCFVEDQKIGIMQ
jgi:hypothetical protein